MTAAVECWLVVAGWVVVLVLVFVFVFVFVVVVLGFVGPVTRPRFRSRPPRGARGR